MILTRSNKNRREKNNNNLETSREFYSGIFCWFQAERKSENYLSHANSSVTIIAATAAEHAKILFKKIGSKCVVDEYRIGDAITQNPWCIVSDNATVGRPYTLVFSSKIQISLKIQLKHEHFALPWICVRVSLCCGAKNHFAPCTKTCHGNQTANGKRQYKR